MIFAFVNKQISIGNVYGGRMVKAVICQSFWLMTSLFTGFDSIFIVYNNNNTIICNCFFFCVWNRYVYDVCRMNQLIFRFDFLLKTIQRQFRRQWICHAVRKKEKCQKLNMWEWHYAGVMNTVGNIIINDTECNKHIMIRHTTK